MNAAPMPMAVGISALATLFIAQRRAGERAGGLIAGLPLISLPCAIVAGMGTGRDEAVATLVGPFVSTGVSAFAFMLLGRRHRYVVLPVALAVTA
jgi:hypothetical protein